MVLKTRVSQTKKPRNQYRRYFRLGSKSMLKCLSALLLPLMLGVFTIMTTFEQQKIARQQRLEDKNESRLQREQEWNIAQDAQKTQMKTLNDQYQDEVLITYVKEISDLLEKKDGSLTSDPLIHTFARGLKH